MIFLVFYKSVTNPPTDGPTDGLTDRRTDRPSYRDARTHLKTLNTLAFLKIIMPYAFRLWLQYFVYYDTLQRSEEFEYHTISRPLFPIFYHFYESIWVP